MDWDKVWDVVMVVLGIVCLGVFGYMVYKLQSLRAQKSVDTIKLEGDKIADTISKEPLADIVKSENSSAD